MSDELPPPVQGAPIETTKGPKRVGLGTAMARGFRGRCPACSEGKLLKGFIEPLPRCSACGENLVPFQTADFGPYLVTFAIGLTFTPMILAANVLYNVPTNLSVGVGLTLALICAMILLPRAKGAAIGLLWSLDVRVG